MNTLSALQAIEDGKKVVSVQVSQTLSKTVYVALDNDTDITEASRYVLEQFSSGMITLSKTDSPANSFLLMKCYTKDDVNQSNDLLDKTALVSE